MKKTLLTLAIVSTFATPIVVQADATLYGRVHQQVIFAEDRDIDFRNAEARIGVKGSSQMDSGLTAFYQIEMAIRGDRGDDTALSSRTNSNVTSYRHVYAGVKGEFGSVKLGRFNNPYKSTYTVDVFKYKSGRYVQVPKRIGNAFTYTSPKLGPINLFAAIVGQGEGDSGAYEDVDAYSIGMDSSFGPVKANVAYYEADASAASALAGKNREVTSLGLAYKANNLYLGFNYESNKDVADVTSIGGTYAFGKTKLGAEYSQQDFDTSGVDTSKFYRLGVYQNLGGKADAYVELINEEVASNDTNELVVGYRVRF